MHETKTSTPQGFGARGAGAVESPEALHLAAVASDQDALRTLWGQLAPGIERLARSYRFSVRRAGIEPEDLVQESFPVLKRAAEAFDPSRGVPFPAFFQACLKNRFTSLLRKRTERPSPDLDRLPARGQEAGGTDRDLLLDDLLASLLPGDPQRERKLRAFKANRLEQEGRVAVGITPHGSYRSGHAVE